MEPKLKKKNITPPLEQNAAHVNDDEVTHRSSHP